MLQNSLICLDMSFGSKLDVSVLKNAAECPRQRLKWTSGTRIMTIFIRIFINDLLSLYASIGGVLELLVLNNSVECTSQRLKWTFRFRVTTIFSCSFVNAFFRCI